MKIIYCIILVLGFVAGISMYVSSYQYDWYTVPDEQVSDLAANLWDKPREVRWHEWYEELEKLETPRKMLHDTSVGLMALAVVMVILYFSTRFPLAQSRTFKNKLSYILIFWLSVVMLFLLQVQYYIHRLNRDEYPAWGDSIFIGFAEAFLVCLILVIVGTPFYIAVFWKTQLPAKIYLWSKAHHAFCIILTLFAAVPSVLCLIAIYFLVRDGNIGGVIITMTTLYTFMSARAGLINYWMNRGVGVSS